MLRLGSEPPITGWVCWFAMIWVVLYAPVGPPIGAFMCGPLSCVGVGLRDDWLVSEGVQDFGLDRDTDILRLVPPVISDVALLAGVLVVKGTVELVVPRRRSHFCVRVALLGWDDRDPAVGDPLPTCPPVRV